MQTPRIIPSPQDPAPGVADTLRRWGLAQDVGGGPAELVSLLAAPCSHACPAGIQVKRYVGLVAEGRYEEALDVVRRANPLAATSGFLCHRPCESECACGDLGRPIPIRALKHLAARMVEETGRPPSAPSCPRLGSRVAVLGGGPAGLTAARDLRLLGHEVTIFEASHRLGGLLVRCVPESRLPRWAIEADIAYVLAHEVEVRLSQTISGPTAAEALLGRGFDAVLVATGAGRAVCAALPGATLVHAALPLLSSLAEGALPPRFRQALVLGAGQVGLALATELALRGEGRVTVTFPQDVASLALDPEVLRAADRAGVILRCGLRPEEAILEGGVVRGVRYRTLASQPGERAGRAVISEGVAVELAADLVVDATARLPELGAWPALDVTPWGTLAVDARDLRTTHGRIFGAGEVVTGARGLIDAVAHGRRAAALVHQALGGEPHPPCPDVGSSAGLRLRLPGAPRQESAWRHVPEGARAARVMPLGVDGVPDGGPVVAVEPMGLAEARRCRRCGPCAECASCSPYCGETIAVDPAGTWVRFPEGVPLPDGVPLAPIRARVDPARCRGCGLCEERCPYAAPRVGLRFVAPGKTALVAKVDPRACRGCGLCVGLCPTSALAQGGFDSRALAARIDALLPLSTEVL